jgi:hypothetical protein
MDYVILNYGLIILAFLITTGAQIFIQSSYKKYSNVGCAKKLSGNEVARMILDKNGLKDVYVVETKGTLTDHYDPSRKVVRLSTKVFHDSSIASVSVAAHECGHAVQDKDGYTFMRIRAALVPFVNFSSYAGYIAIVIGLIFELIDLIWIGIGLEIVILLFQLVTLPVEIDASKRAVNELKSMDALTEEELSGGKLMLTAAAMTYVASVASTVLEILRLILIFGRDRD